MISPGPDESIQSKAIENKHRCQGWLFDLSSRNSAIETVRLISTDPGAGEVSRLPLILMGCFLPKKLPQPNRFSNIVPL
ncbi:hypothetical protein ACFPMF_08055 [Larkinella bovis]|uniref:Uncharacterized protein n=1 Tax=Larkinella bovis TaxID=683041 RepID=A0ABW0I6W1_9BACT